MDHETTDAMHVSDLEHQACTEYHIGKSTAELLAALASIVVDAIMKHKDDGLKPSDIMRMYEEDIPPLPSVPTRKPRRKKEIKT